MLPTLLILHLKAPQMLPVAEGFSVLPYVVPAIALVSAVGPLYRIILPQALNSPLGLVPLYMVVIMPFVYRSLDAGIRVVDVRTLWDASSSLGAGAVTTLVRAILPNLRSAIMSASLLGCAIVLGEFAIAQLLLKTTFPVILSQIGTSLRRWPSSRLWSHGYCLDCCQWLEEPTNIELHNTVVRKTNDDSCCEFFTTGDIRHVA